MIPTFASSIELALYVCTVYIYIYMCVCVCVCVCVLCVIVNIYEQKEWYRLLDIFQQFTFVIKQKEQNTNLNISNNTNRYDR